MEIVFELLKDLKFSSLVDVGCGDGRFLSELSKLYPAIEFLGVDYSEKAISIAKAMNPEIRSQYTVRNIVQESITNTYDVATLIEVLEHIHPKQVDAFVKAISALLNEKGFLILTVPHKNKLTQDKHYQHFNSVILENILEPYFDNIKFIPFDQKSKVMNSLLRLIGGQGYYYVLTHPKILRWFYKAYLKRYLYASGEYNCGRIAVICRKK